MQSSTFLQTRCFRRRYRATLNRTQGDTGVCGVGFVSENASYRPTNLKLSAKMRAQRPHLWAYLRPRGRNTRVFRCESRSTPPLQTRPRAAPGTAQSWPLRTHDTRRLLTASCAWRGCPGTPASPCTTQGHWPCPCGLQSSQTQPEVRDISFA